MSAEKGGYIELVLSKLFAILTNLGHNNDMENFNFKPTRVVENEGKENEVLPMDHLEQIELAGIEFEGEESGAKQAAFESMRSEVAEKAAAENERASSAKDIFLN